MMKKTLKNNRKSLKLTTLGFTLIELLAIIVILAIIALIAIPVVLNIIDKARVASYKRSSENILDAARIYQKEAMIDTTMSIEGNNYNKVMESIAGRKPDSGEIYIKKSGEIALALKYDKYCYKKTYTQMEITETESEECNLDAELDENAPIITAKEESVTLIEDTSTEITSYFNIDANGASGIKSTVCKNGDISTTNTSALEVGTHTITCTVTKNNDKTASATINVTVSANQKTAAEVVEYLGLTVVTEGDGLYLDSDGVYRYKGSNPSNYIELGNEEYRIVAIEDQGIKVTSASAVIDTIPFDEGSTVYYTDCTDEVCPRFNSNNTYCQVIDMYEEYCGCNIWAKSSEIKQNGVVSSSFDNGNKTIPNVGSWDYQGTVTQDSTVYKYLNDTYYPTLSSVDEYIVKDATWNVGPVNAKSSEEEDDVVLASLEGVINQQNDWTWNGKIGLISLSEYVQAQLPSGNSYSSCIANVFQNSNCASNNWADGFYRLTLTPMANLNSHVYYIYSGTYGGLAGTEYEIYPAFYIKNTVTLQGNGTQGANAFRIVES